jgi:hypothetical protein
MAVTNEERLRVLQELRSTFQLCFFWINVITFVTLCVVVLRPFGQIGTETVGCDLALFSSGMAAVAGTAYYGVNRSIKRLTIHRANDRG